MTDQFGPSEQACLLNASAQCNRIWVAKSVRSKVRIKRLRKNRKSSQSPLTQRPEIDCSSRKIIGIKYVALSIILSYIANKISKEILYRSC
jgi:hypothetical protein